MVGIEQSFVKICSITIGGTIYLLRDMGSFGIFTLNPSTACGLVFGHFHYSSHSGTSRTNSVYGSDPFWTCVQE
jgi:hypothetical protein